MTSRLISSTPLTKQAESKANNSSISQRAQTEVDLSVTIRTLVACLVAVLLPISSSAEKPRGADGYEVVCVYPHDSDAFTQGLVFVDGHLYESTGRYGKSSLRMVDLLTG